MLPRHRDIPSAFVVAALLAVAAPASMAQSVPAAPRAAPGRTYVQPERNFGDSLLTYIGASAGVTEFDVVCPTTAACDQTGVGGRLYAGGQFSRNLGLEVAYVNLGRPDGIGGGRRRSQGLGISLVGILPVGSFGELNVRVGTLYSRSQNSGILASTYGASAKGFGLALGAGFGVNVTPNVQLRVDWDRHNLEINGSDTHVDMLAAGLRFLF